MQLAEAMACGTKCFAPNHSALAEVGGKYVIHIDEHNPQNIALIIIESYRNNLHNDDLSEQIEYTKKYSWDNTAIEIAQQLIRLAGLVKK